MVYQKDSFLKKELLRFTTAGSVDDGKSTLIGRLLYDTQAIYQDQLEALKNISQLRGEDEIDLALLTDGLRAEREQGITIDVAYRYFSTVRRKYIIADTPGHEQYTRNMVTGASTADVAIILIDARNGVLTQSRRHGFIASLLGIPHLVVAVNKMDLVGWSQEVFQCIVEEYKTFSQRLSIHDIVFIPISALHGDNVVTPSKNMPWYDGVTILKYLENVTISADRNLIDFRFPVQYVIRTNNDFRGFAGRISSGIIRRDDEVLILPSKIATRVKTIVTPDGEVAEAFAGQSVVLTLKDEIDLSRGEMLVRSGNLPYQLNLFEANLCWMDDSKPLSLKNHYILQHTTRKVHAFIIKLRYRINVNTLHREYTQHLVFNEIGRVVIETAHPIFFDEYERNRETGSFILVDPMSNLTVAAGMIVKPILGTTIEEEGMRLSSNIVWEDRNIKLQEREVRNGHPAHVFWFTGLSGSGKTTIARELERLLFKAGKQVYLLDGDNIRFGLNADLGFSERDRRENIRRIAHVARLMFDAGFIVLCSFISPHAEMRSYARSLFPDRRFSEIYVKCSLAECQRRDPKGLYQKALVGDIPLFTGISAPYEEPQDPDLILDTENNSPKILISQFLKHFSFLKAQDIE